MTEQQTAQAQGDGGVAQQPASQPAPAVAQPVAQPEAQPATQQGFGQGQPVNGFTQPVQPVAQPATPVVETDNARTREQFEKLTETNQRLATQQDAMKQQYELLRQELQQIQQRTQGNKQFESTQVPQQQPTAPQQGQQSAMPKLSDYIEVDDQGNRFVNEQKFNAAVSEIYQKASRAEEVVQNYVRQTEQREVERQEKEAFEKYPNLNPKGTEFDTRLSQQTRAIIYDSMVNPQDYGGRPLTFKEAADFVSTGSVKPQAPVATTPTPTANVENQVQKEQAAAQAQSVPQQVTASVDADQAYNRLVNGTRVGSDEALALRLKNSPHRLTDLEGQSN